MLRNLLCVIYTWIPAEILPEILADDPPSIHARISQVISVGIELFFSGILMWSSIQNPNSNFFRDFYRNLFNDSSSNYFRNLSINSSRDFFSGITLEIPLKKINWFIRELSRGFYWNYLRIFSKASAVFRHVIPLIIALHFLYDSFNNFTWNFS